MELEKLLTFEIKDKKLLFRTIVESDVTEDYVTGLREQAEYIENIPNNINISNQKEYVNNTNFSEYNTICGLFLDEVLVGTAGVQLSLSDSFLKNIDIQVAMLATVGIFIFNKSYRGMGLGKILVWASTYLFHECTRIEWFGAGMAKENIPSLKSFLSCGFQKVYEDYEVCKTLLNQSNLVTPSFIHGVKLI